MNSKQKKEDEDLILHPIYGINAKLGLCPHCGEQNNQIVLLGINNSIFMCSTCEKQFYGVMKPPKGVKKSKVCPCCNSPDIKYIREIDEWEKIVTDCLCPKCQEEENYLKKLVEEGGIYWSCPKKHYGVIKKESPVARMVREKLNIDPPGLCRLEFPEKMCPVCSPMNNNEIT